SRDPDDFHVRGCIGFCRTSHASAHDRCGHEQLRKSRPMEKRFRPPIEHGAPPSASAVPRNDPYKRRAAFVSRTRPRKTSRLFSRLALRHAERAKSTILSARFGGRAAREVRWVKCRIVLGARSRRGSWSAPFFWSCRACRLGEGAREVTTE